jgi:hypothetical protein
MESYNTREPGASPGSEKVRTPEDHGPTRLYRWEDVRKGLDEEPRRPVFIADNGAEVDALFARGYLATCTARNWIDGDWSPLADRDAVVLGRGDPYGRDESARLAGALHKIGARVKVIVPRGIEPRQTLVEWFDADPTRNAHQLAATAELAPPFQPRPEIEITTRRHEVRDEAIRALARDLDLYRRGANLVTIATEEEDQLRLTGKTALREVAGSPRIVTLSDPNVGCHLTRNALFYRMKLDRDGNWIGVDVHPPDWLIAAVASHQHWPGIRPLLGVAECPFPRPDGSIVATPGYDPETGIFLRPSIDFPAVPDEPTRDDARAAWCRIRAILDQFPFPSDNDRAVWLAGLLGTIGRHAVIGPVPGIAVVGNKPGTGKGLLIDAIGILAGGRNVPTSVYPADPIEAGKVKTAIALSGKAIVHFDNLEEGSTYGNSALDSALTSLTVDDRILGTSKTTGEIPLRVSWFLSGNNLSPGKDAYRRWLPLNLVTALERPEERRDIAIEDLRSYLIEHRGEFVRDALTILRAHALAGRPRGEWAPLGSFEEWDRVIRGAVWYSGAGDCCETRRTAADEAPARLAKIALLEGWRELDPNGAGVTAAKAVERAAELVKPDGPEMVVGKSETTPRHPTLHNALLLHGKDGKLATARSIGNIIRGMRENVIAGMKFTTTGEDHRAIKWAVKVVPNTPDSQEDGESTSLNESDFHSPRVNTRTDYDVNTCGGKCEISGNGSETHSSRLVDSPDDADEGRVRWTG